MGASPCGCRLTEISCFTTAFLQWPRLTGPPTPGEDLLAKSRYAPICKRTGIWSSTTKLTNQYGGLAYGGISSIPISKCRTTAIWSSTTTDGSPYGHRRPYANDP